MTLTERIRKFIIDILQFYDDNSMEQEIQCFYETARCYLSIEELLSFYSLDDVIKYEYDIKHTVLLQRDIEALWENRLEEMVKEP